MLRNVRRLCSAIAGALVLSALATGTAHAQRLQLGISQAPYYTDVPIEVQITAEGFEEEPQPEIEPHGPAATYLQLTGVSPNVSRSVRIVNGQITQTSSVRFVYSYRFTPPKPGRYQVGPFRVTQGSVSKVSGLTNIMVESVPVTGGQKVRVKLPKGDLFVGQRIPLQVEWWVSSDLRGSLFNQRIVVPLLDRADAFAVDSITQTDANGRELRASIVITVGGTPAEYPARERLRTEGGVEYVVRTAELVVVPLVPGEYEFAPASVTVDQATRWRRDLFGSRVPSEARKIRAVGRPQSVHIRDVPRKGRPAGYAGAVGTGFTIDVSADRSVVQVGDPITLSITLRGSGSIESASLPNLIGEHALGADDFRVVRKPSAGVYQDGEKRFEAVIRTTHAGVTEIAPIEYAWFDPAAAEFRSYNSRPIALSVKAAQVVGAGDVVRSTPDPGDAADESAGTDAPADRPTGEQGATQRPAFTLTGADLAIVRDPARLAGGGSANVRRWGCYALGIALLGVGILRRRRGEIDPVEAALRKQLIEQRRRIDGATAADEITDALRRMAAIGEVTDRRTLEALLAELDAISYARDVQAVRIDANLKERAREAAATITETPR